MLLSYRNAYYKDDIDNGMHSVYRTGGISENNTVFFIALTKTMTYVTIKTERGDSMSNEIIVKAGTSITLSMQKELKRYGLSEFDYAGIKVLKFKKGEHLCKEGFPMENFLFMVEGKAKAYINLSDGKSILSQFYVNAGVLGEIELMTGGLASVSVEAMSEVTCMAIPMYEYRSELLRNINFMNLVAKELAGKLEKTAKNGAVSVLLPLEARLCSYIIMVSENGLFKEKLNTTSEMLGTSYRHLLRSLDSLRKDGVLGKVAGGYIIADRTELQRRAQDIYSL